MSRSRAPSLGHVVPDDTTANLARNRLHAHNLRKDLQHTYSEINESIRRFEQSWGVLWSSLESTVQSAAHNGAVQENRDKFRDTANQLFVSLNAARHVHPTLIQLDGSLIASERHLEYMWPEGRSRHHAHAHADADAAPPVFGSPSMGRESNLPALVEQYFDKIGDVNLLAEKLHELMPNLHLEQIEEREMRRDQDKPVSQSDSDFEAAYQRQLAETTTRMTELQAVAESIRLKCIDAGYSTDPLHYIMRSDGASSIREDGVERWLGDVPIGLDALSESQNIAKSCSASLRTSSVAGESESETRDMQDVVQDSYRTESMPTIKDEPSHARASKFKLSAQAQSFKPVAFDSADVEASSASQLLTEPQTTSEELACYMSSSSPVFQPTQGYEVALTGRFIGQTYTLRDDQPRPLFKTDYEHWNDL